MLLFLLSKLKQIDEKLYKMHEKLILLSDIDIIKLLGTNNKKIDIISKNFPNVKIIARGENIKLIGNLEDIHHVNKTFSLLISHIKRYQNITISQINSIIQKNQEIKIANDIILHVKNGRPIKARTINQNKIVSEISINDMLFAIGPAGTGKTYTAVALAVKALKSKQVKRIILTRPAIEAGENLGFLPGDLKDKLDPYMQPIYDALFEMIEEEKLNYLISNRTIQIAPLAFMRGRTLDNAFVILDEAQNTTKKQMKMFLTRMGKGSKFVITGDSTQVDLPKDQESGLIHVKKHLNKIKGISFVELNEKDIVRHKLINRIIKAY